MAEFSFKQNTLRVEIEEGELEAGDIRLQIIIRRPRNDDSPVAAPTARFVSNDAGKTAFIQKLLDTNKRVSLRDIQKGWAESGHTSTISSSLFYKVKSRMGLTKTRS